VHPTYKNWSGTLLNGLLWYVRARTGAQPRIVTRLDKDTSGLVIVALTPEAQARIQQHAAAGCVRKEYLALVHGIPVPSRGVIVLPLGRSADDRRRVVVMPDGQVSETRYEVLSSRNGYSLVRCELVTGRTHQIRVHLAARGCPIVGDAVYGPGDGRAPRQALHAWRVALLDPATRTAIQLEAPLPADMMALLDSAGMAAPQNATL
jgi:23S rRNA pseudouridine1911/1915/1917 synthase